MINSRPNPQTLHALATALSAVLRPADVPDCAVTGVGAPGAASETTLTFAEDARSLAAAIASGSAATLTTAPLADQVAGAAPQGAAMLVVAHPKLAFAQAARLLQAAPQATGVHPQAFVAGSASLGERVSIGAFAVIGDNAVLADDVRVDAGAVIGEGSRLAAGCHIYPRAVLYPGVMLGERVRVHAGAVLGSDGFGYVRDVATGAYLQFPQQGTLVVEDDVEIGANTAIDRGALAETRIGRGVKLDNLVHVGHNVQIGQNVVIAAQTGISGSSRLGNGAIVAGQVGIADHVTIGAGTILGAQCGVPSNKRIEGPGTLFWGTPARPIAQYLKELAMLARLARAGRAALSHKEGK